MNDLVVTGAQARLNITYAGSNGDLPDLVSQDATDATILAMVTEAVRSGSVPGLLADPNADFSDFVVDRFAPTEARPLPLLQVRPKTPFGASEVPSAEEWIRCAAELELLRGVEVWVRSNLPVVDPTLSVLLDALSALRGGKPRC